jgi:hypothetical protein
MGGFDLHLRPPSPGLIPGSGVMPPVPNVKLSRPSLLGPAEGSATLDGFATNSAALTSNHRRQLRALAGSLQHLLSQPSGGRVQAVGHTDVVGTEEHNDRLGQQRADAVRDELVADGLHASDIHTSSLGESVPVVDTPRADPRNRRVEVSFAPGSGLNLHGVLSGSLRRPDALHPTPLPSLRNPILNPGICTLNPELCRPTPPTRVPSDLYAPIPPLPQRHLPSLSDAIWHPIDQALENGFRSLGLSDEWNRRLRGAARAGAAKGATELLNQAMDAAHLTGETRDAVGTALRAAVQLEIPFQ